MRRKDKAVEDLRTQEAIIGKARVCRLGLCDEGQPYVVPLCFGYEGGVIYLHSARVGRKIEILKRNQRVCVEFDLDGPLEVNETACRWTMHFQSVIAFGTAEIVTSQSEQKKGLDLIMAHYNDSRPIYSEEGLTAATIVKITIREMTSKKG